MTRRARRKRERGGWGGRGREESDRDQTRRDARLGADGRASLFS